MAVAKSGKAAIAVVSKAFMGLGRAQASALKFAALPICVIDHPFGSRKRDEVKQMAVRCVDDIMVLMGASVAA